MTTVAEWYGQGRSGENPKVSVCTITYNHEAFIGDAIEGVLKQEIDFPVEMVIGEDCSPDGTRDVILQYAQKYPGFIQLSEYKHNIGSAENFRATSGRCRGEYVAMLDGDDFWTSPHKLRKQVELMDARPDLSMCFHAASGYAQDGQREPFPIYPPGRRPVYRLSDLCLTIKITASSILYRRAMLPPLPNWIADVLIGDWALQVFLAAEGDIGYIDELMGMYRLHGNSIFFGQGVAGTPKHLRLLIKQQELFSQYLGEQRARPFLRARNRTLYALCHTYIQEGDLEKARETLKAAFQECGYQPGYNLTEPFRALLHLHAPRLYRSLWQSWLKLRGSSVWD